MSLYDEADFIDADKDFRVENDKTNLSARYEEIGEYPRLYLDLVAMKIRFIQPFGDSEVELKDKALLAALALGSNDCFERVFCALNVNIEAVGLCGFSVDYYQRYMHISQ